MMPSSQNTYTTNNRMNDTGKCRRIIIYTLDRIIINTLLSTEPELQVANYTQ